MKQVSTMRVMLCRIREGLLLFANVDEKLESLVKSQNSEA